MEPGSEIPLPFSEALQTSGATAIHNIDNSIQQSITGPKANELQDSGKAWIRQQFISSKEQLPIALPNDPTLETNNLIHLISDTDKQSAAINAYQLLTLPSSYLSPETADVLSRRRSVQDAAASEMLAQGQRLSKVGATLGSDLEMATRNTSPILREGSNGERQLVQDTSVLNSADTLQSQELVKFRAPMLAAVKTDFLDTHALKMDNTTHDVSSDAPADIMCSSGQNCGWRQCFADLNREVELVKAELSSVTGLDQNDTAKEGNNIVKLDDVTASYGGNDIGLQGLTVILHMEGHDDYIVDTDLTGKGPFKRSS